MCANRVLQVGWTLFLALALGLFPGARTSSAQATGTVVGRVVTQADLPAADAQVRLVNLGRAARVAEDGRFRFDEVPAGSYLLEVTSERSGRAIERVTVRAGGETEVAITVSPLYHGQEIVVGIGPRAVGQLEAFQATEVIRGRELRDRSEATLGETLANEPGINSTYFGPGASRPVIRGLGGDRIRILESGVGTGDVSSTSPDHAVAIEPGSLERIEIIRGPATLLYGSSAIGGVVNTIDGRIPTELPTRAFSGRVTARGGTVANERNGAVQLNGAFGRIAWHASGLIRDTDDYNIPRGALRDHDEEGEHGGDEDLGVVANSFVETLKGAAGISYVGANGYLGVSWSGYGTEYGVPGHGHAEGEQEQEEEAEHDEDVFIDGRQQRFDAEGAWRFASPLFQRLRVRLGYSTYRHDELEDDEIETTFESDEWEGRLELQHRFADWASGAFGLQFRTRDFSAVGEEAFVPPTDTDVLALFLFEEFGGGPVRLQTGGRFEHQRILNRGTGVRRTDDGVSLSLGANWSPADRFSFALSGSRSVKLPNAEELFSDGPHLATRGFEVGNPELEKEVGYSLDATARLTGDPVSGSVSFFVNRMNDFIFLAFTGEEEDGLPVRRYDQRDAVFRGFEARAEIDLLHHAEHGHHVVVDVWGDYVRASFLGMGGNLPQIPPFRFGSGLRYEGEPLQGGVGVRRVTRQDRVAPFEEATDGYTMLDASAGLRFFSGGLVHEVGLRGINLTDQVARNHVSFLKEVAPLPGREVRLTYSVSW